MCTGGVIKMENRGYEDTRDQPKERQEHGAQNTGGERYSDDQRPLVPQDIWAL